MIANNKPATEQRKNNLRDQKKWSPAIMLVHNNIKCICCNRASLNQNNSPEIIRQNMLNMDTQVKCDIN